jgi:hypothetical protein
MDRKMTERDARMVRSNAKGKTMSNHTDRAGVPIIENVQGKIGVLERRVEYLDRRLGNSEYANTKSSEFDRIEVGALRGGIRALRFHAATLRPELDPVVHLARLASASRAALAGFREELEPGEALTDAELKLQRVLHEVEQALAELA